MPSAPERLDPRLTPEVLRDIMAAFNRGCDCCEPEAPPPANRFACEPAGEDEPE